MSPVIKAPGDFLGNWLLMCVKRKTREECQVVVAKASSAERVGTRHRLSCSPEEGFREEGLS